MRAAEWSLRDFIEDWNIRQLLAWQYPNIVIPSQCDVELFTPPCAGNAQLVQPAQPKELVRLPGLSTPGVLVRKLSWNGAPPVLHVEYVDSKAFTDLEVALELEERLTRKEGGFACYNFTYKIDFTGP